MWLTDAKQERMQEHASVACMNVVRSVAEQLIDHGFSKRDAHEKAAAMTFAWAIGDFALDWAAKNATDVLCGE